MKYIAFLRGINVGGNRTVKMSDLVQLLFDNKFQNVKTLLNSGNVVLESTENDKQKLTKTIEQILKEKFGWHITVMFRSIDEIQKLIDKDPFKGIELTKDSRFYVTFLAEENKGTLKVPYQFENINVLSANGFEVCWVLVLTKEGQTGEGMKLIDKEYGKLNSTTRNWNTVLKIAQL